MPTVAITGVGGLVGRRLAEELGARADVSRILGLDVRMPDGLDVPRLTVRHVDIREPGLGSHLDGVDVVINLAAQVDPVRDEDTMRAINVGGAQNVLRAAADAGVSHVIHLSSAVVYGAHRDNDLPLTEASPLRPNPDFAYASQKAEVDRFIEEWAPQHPQVTVSVLRPAIIAGPGVENFISRLLEVPRPVAVAGHKPPLQFVHVDDVVDAITHLVAHPVAGVFNLASEGWLSFDEVLAISGRRFTFLGEEVAFAAASRMWELGIGEAPAGFIHYLMHPWVMSVESLMATGWRPERSNRDALSALVAEHRGFVSLGRIRTTRAALRRVGATVVGAITLLSAWGLRRRRRRDED